MAKERFSVACGAHFFLVFFLFKAGIPPLYFEAGRDGSFQTLVARGAGLCAADSRRKNGFQSVDVR